MDYEILRVKLDPGGMPFDLLKLQIGERTSDGWEPLGGPFHIAEYGTALNREGPWLCQAVVRRDHLSSE